jgi:hypothetical protein
LQTRSRRTAGLGGSGKLVAIGSGIEHCQTVLKEGVSAWEQGVQRQIHSSHEFLSRALPE